MLGWLPLHNNNGLIFFTVNYENFRLEKVAAWYPQAHMDTWELRLCAVYYRAAVRKGGGWVGGTSAEAGLHLIQFTHELFLWQRVKPLRGPGLLTIHHLLHFLRSD